MVRWILGIWMAPASMSSGKVTTYSMIHQVTYTISTCAVFVQVNLRLDIIDVFYLV